MIADPKVRAIGLHLGTAAAASVATAMWLASHSVDMYAIMDQLNAVVREVGKLVALVVPFATGAWQVWKSTNKQATIDVAAIPGTLVVTTPAIARATPDSPNVVSSTDMKVVPK